MQEKDMDFSFLIGAWEIVECGLETARGDSQGVSGAMLELTECGDVSWRLPENYIDIPIFTTDTYEAVVRGPFLSALIRFGSYKGHAIEFRIEKYDSDEQIMALHEGLLYMTCKKLTNGLPNECVMELPYTLLPAYEEGCFADLSIIASNGREFRVHTFILKLLAPDIDWTAEPAPFSGLADNIINIMVHYLYTYSLPTGLTVEAAEQVIITASNYPGLDYLISLCQNYIDNVAVAREMATLISDVKSLFMQATVRFAIPSDDAKDPGILCNALKNAVRDVVVVMAKMLHFCDIYNKRKDKLSKKGVMEIIRFTKSHIKFFVNQLHIFMEVVKAMVSLSARERRHLARYLLPEVGHIFDNVIDVLLCTREFFQAVLVRLGAEKCAEYRLTLYNLNEHMERIYHRKEINKFQFLVHRVGCLMRHLKKKRDRFCGLTEENKVRTLTRNIDHFIDQLPFLFLQVEEILEDVEQKCEWMGSQFCFKMSTAKAGEFLDTLLENKESLQTLCSILCDAIQQDEFTRTIFALGILDRPEDDIDNLVAGVAGLFRPDDRALDLTQFISDLPLPRQNALCKIVLEKLKDGLETDMVLRVFPSEVPDDYEDNETKYLGDGTDNEGDSVNGQSEADVRVADAKVEDASSADRGCDDCEVTASETCGKTEGGGPDGAATGDAETEGEVSTGKQVDGTADGNSEAVCAVLTAEGDGAVRGKSGKEDAVLTGKDEGAECGITEGDVITFNAHRVIIAARCPLFRKALLSGMLEDINRQIDVHNISPKLFPFFLEYLYSGIMDYSTFTPREIVQMFVIADCYELDSFKQGCETALEIFLDDNSVLLFLNMAHKYNAPILKDACKKYISEHPTVPLDNVFYEELPRKLKDEILDLVKRGTYGAAHGSDVAGACALESTESDAEA